MYGQEIVDEFDVNKEVALDKAANTTKSTTIVQQKSNKLANTTVKSSVKTGDSDVWIQPQPKNDKKALGQTKHKNLVAKVKNFSVKKQIKD